MAVEGSFDPKNFSVQDPVQMLWARRMWDWDTKNPFAAGEQGVHPLQIGGFGGREMELVRARPVNMLANPRTLSFGGRNYGDQSIDNNEWARLKNTGSTFQSLVQQSVAQRKGLGLSGAQPGSSTGTTQNQTPVPGPINRAQRWLQNRRMTKQGVPPPPGAPQASSVPPVLPPPTAPSPHPLATSNWREEQAQRIAEGELGQPGQSAPDVTLGSRAYQERVAQNREAGAQTRRAQTSVSLGGAPQPPPATSAERFANAQRRIAAQQATRTTPTSPLPQAVPNRPGSTFTLGPVPTTPAPVGMAGDQSQRLASEGVATPTTGNKSKKKSTRKK